MSSTCRKRIDWDGVLAAAEQLGLTVSQVAAQQGVSYSSAYDAAARRGIALPRGPRGRHGKFCKLDAEFRAAIINGQSAARFCIEHDISGGTLDRIERRHGMKLKRKPKHQARHDWPTTPERAP